MNPFITVDPDKAHQIKTMPAPHGGGRGIGPLTQALLDGQMVYVTGANKHKRPSNTTLTDRGMRLRQRTADNGVYFWAEQL